MPEPLMRIENLVKRFGGVTATDNVTLEVEQGELHAVIGPNGAGKTTLIAQIAGMMPTDAGRIEFDGRTVTSMPAHKLSALGLARSFQVTSIFLNFTAIENVALSVQAHAGDSFRFWFPADKDASLREPAMRALEQVGLQERADVIAHDLSHGEQRQLEIAMAIATQPKMLLLDEPMAGMGTEDTARMIEVLRDFKRRYTILLIEHDMDAVFKLADRITVMVYGRVIKTGIGDEIRADPQVQQAYLGED